MIEAIKVVKESFIQYIGTGSYMILFLLALIYIYKKEEKKEIRNFLWFSLIIFVITLNPIFYKAIRKCIGNDVYWRMFWCLPMGVILAYVGTKIIEKNNKKIEQVLIGISIIIIIMLSGKCVFNRDNFTLATNWYKLPQEALDITRMIEADENDNRKTLLAPTDMVSYVRQYDASIHMRVMRISTGCYEKEPIVAKMENGDVEAVVADSKSYGTNYIVFKKETILSKSIEDYGFSKLGETEKYILYKAN